MWGKRSENKWKFLGISIFGKIDYAIKSILILLSKSVLHSSTISKHNNRTKLNHESYTDRMKWSSKKWQLTNLIGNSVKIRFCFAIKWLTYNAAIFILKRDANGDMHFKYLPTWHNSISAREKACSNWTFSRCLKSFGNKYLNVAFIIFLARYCGLHIHVLQTVSTPIILLTYCG